MSLGRRSAFSLAAAVMLFFAVWLAAADVSSQSAHSTAPTGPIHQLELESSGPQSVSLLLLGFGLALTARTLKRQKA
jgi:hypothetical protein